MKQDIRWKQRFSNFKKAFEQLEIAVKMSTYTDLEREGLIQRFEYTYELAWLTMKDYLEDQGYQNITGSKDAIKQALQAGLLENAEDWMEMVESRKLSTHTYDMETAKEIAGKVINEYYEMFRDLINRLTKENNEK